MKLVIEVEIKNDFLDGTALMLAVPYVLDQVSSNLLAGVAAGSGELAPPGLKEPVKATFRQRWVGASEEGVRERLSEEEPQQEEVATP